MSGKKNFLFAVTMSVFCLVCSCSTLPEGDVPPSLVGEIPPEQESLSQKDAEAAMCGAIVRTLVRLGHSSERTPLAFTIASSPQRTEFVSLLTGTNMILFSRTDSAKYLVDSKLKDGAWTLQLTKKDGTILLAKTVRYH